MILCSMYTALFLANFRVAAHLQISLYAKSLRKMIIRKRSNAFSLAACMEKDAHVLCYDKGFL